MASLQLPVKYPQLSALQIDQIQMLIWCTYVYCIKSPFANLWELIIPLLSYNY